MSAAELPVEARDSAPSARIPLWLKVAYTLFLAVMVPVYWDSYGPANFLWFCDVALLFTLFAVWTEKPLLASIPAVGIVLPQILWVADFLIALVSGWSPVGLSSYMFDERIRPFVRGLSLFHGWLPLLLLWLVWRLGYDRRALAWQTVVCWVVLIASFLLVTDLDPDGAGNVNKVFGPADESVQTWMPRVAWLGVLMAAYPLVLYVPSHFLFQAIFPPARQPISSRTPA